MRIAWALVIVGALATTAHADNLPPEPPEDMTPCADTVIDPIVTPVREAGLDAQRSACLRRDLSAGLLAHALIDTPGFHGVLGGGLELGGRVIVGKAHELSASLTLADFTFVQNAVNKVTHTGYGPIVIGAAAGKAMGRGARAALALRLELPLTDDQSDTTHAGAQLAGLVSGALSHHVVLHARLASLGRITSSLGGETYRLAFVAGTDLAWQPRRRIALQLGADAMAGWAGGFDHLLVRAGVNWRLRGGAWHLRAGAGVPVAGNERTTAILDVAIVVDR